MIQQSCEAFKVRGMIYISFWMILTFDLVINDPIIKYPFEHVGLLGRRIRKTRREWLEQTTKIVFINILIGSFKRLKLDKIRLIMCTLCYPPYLGV